MKWRRLVALALAGTMAFGSALAAGGDTAAADQELMEVTAKVKATLGLDTQEFDDFRGWSDENVLLGKRWSLSWDGDGVSLSITADSQGKIYSYSRSESVSEEMVNVRYFGGRLQIPSLPEDKSQECYEAAQDFLSKVLEAGVETVELENDAAPSLTATTYRFSSTILLNGLPSPTTCWVTVRAKDGRVTQFRRSDERAGYLGELPTPDTKVTEAAAQRLLRSTLEFEARYILGEDNVATVQYVPTATDDYYVDGKTGELVNLTELRAKLWENGSVNRFDMMASGAAAPEAAMNKAELTQAEQEGAAILESAMDKEALAEAVANAWPEIGLDKYTLASASYSIREKEIGEGAERTPDDYDVTCTLTFGRQDKTVTARKYVRADAKTGELLSLSSSRYDQDWEAEPRISTSLRQGEPVVQRALSAFAGDNYAKLGLFETSDAKDVKGGWQHTYTYQHTAYGYFYSGNSYTVGVDATDGTLAYLSGHFDEAVTLKDPGQVVGMEKAKDAYAQAMVKDYRYLEVPVSINLADDGLRPLLKEAGYSYVNALKPGYVFRQSEPAVRSVDASTGEVVYDPSYEAEENHVTYSDLEGHWVADAARALAVFDIGFLGGELRPNATLTQVDMLALVCSVEGWQIDPAKADKEKLDWFYERAYSLGLVTPETRDEDKEISRGELVRLLLDTAGYTKVAQIPGIFRCDFADADAIPQADQGYAALAQGLGLVRGGSDGAYAAGRAATRAEAIAMLYQYMK